MVNNGDKNKQEEQLAFFFSREERARFKDAAECSPLPLLLLPRRSLFLEILAPGSSLSLSLSLTPAGAAGGVGTVRVSPPSSKRALKGKGVRGEFVPGSLAFACFYGGVRGGRVGGDGPAAGASSMLQCSAAAAPVRLPVPVRAYTTPARLGLPARGQRRARVPGRAGSCGAHEAARHGGRAPGTPPLPLPPSLGPGLEGFPFLSRRTEPGTSPTGGDGSESGPTCRWVAMEERGVRRPGLVPTRTGQSNERGSVATPAP